MPAGASSLHLLGFVEDTRGKSAALVRSAQAGVQLIEADDEILVTQDGRSRKLRVHKITDHGLLVQDGHEERTIPFRQ